MDVSSIISLISLVINFIMIIIGGVWAVSRIKNTADTTATTLASSINHLAENISKLESWLEKVDGKVEAQGLRMARMEGQLGLVKRDVDQVKDKNT